MGTILQSSKYSIDHTRQESGFRNWPKVFRPIVFVCLEHGSGYLDPVVSLVFVDQSRVQVSYSCPLVNVVAENVRLSKFVVPFYKRVVSLKQAFSIQK